MLNAMQQHALSQICKRHNLFICGPAGSGKSFLLEEVFKELKREGKSVHLTCTTGIACTNYDNFLGASTIHCWAGMEDGRFDANEICAIIKNNVKFKRTYERIISTDTLIIDEISMLSLKMFELLSEICRLKDSTQLFGGLQVVVCGDFYQLAPVANSLYNDDGKYCFKSNNFKKMFPHRVYLTTVMRQSERRLIRCISEVSGKENISADSMDFINSINKPLLETTKSTKLFATNFLVDTYNCMCLTQEAGEVYEYVSTDSGDQKYLDTILAPKKLWLKIGCPVILLRNLSDRRANGLKGFVVGCETDGPMVEFPTRLISTKIPKLKLSVYNPKQSREVAVRIQVPLKPSYAITIHKVQGMTLDSVEIDCQDISKPGELDVAMGRVRKSASLRIINFV